MRKSKTCRNVRITSKECLGMTINQNTIKNKDEMSRLLNEEVKLLLTGVTLDNTAVKNLIAVKLASDKFKPDASYQEVVNGLVEAELERLKRKNDFTLQYIQTKVGKVMDEMTDAELASYESYLEAEDVTSSILRRLSAVQL